MKDWYPWAKGSAGWNLSVAPLSVARNAGLHQEGAAGGRRTEGQVPPALQFPVSLETGASGQGYKPQSQWNWRLWLVV